MRAVLELNENANIAIEEEFALLKDYLDLEKLRFEDKFDYEIQCPEELSSLNIPTMILQPFVENSVVHGFTEIDAGGRICISAKINDGNYLLLNIEDNGKGYQKKESKETSGKKSMAMGLIEQRLKLLSRADGKNYRFEISNLNVLAGKQGTLVQLYLPYSSI